MSGRGILDVPGIGAAHVTDEDGATGCTVVVAPKGAVAGVDVRGSAPGTRETDVLNPINLVSQAHAICLCGGSAFGLDVASGVMRRLAETGIGLDVGVGVVPIVPAAVLFDLSLGPPSHPSPDMGYRAAHEALASVDCTDARLAQGNVGAGCGATVGKVLGMSRAMKSGIGHTSRQLPGGLVVAAVVAVNAVGEVRNPHGDVLLAGCRDESNRILSALDCLVAREFADVAAGADAGGGPDVSAGADVGGGPDVGAGADVGRGPDVGAGADAGGGPDVGGGPHASRGPDVGGGPHASRGPDVPPGTNTTIGIVATNARLTKVQATKVAQMAHDGLARCIQPVHTMYDGDTMFAMATGEVEVGVDVVGSIAADVVAEAIVFAVKSARMSQGLPAWWELLGPGREQG